MIIKNILRGLSLSAPRPDVMYDGGIIMKNIMFGNSLMLLAIFLFMWCGFMKSMYVLMWIAIALILIGFIIAVVGYISKDKK